MTQTQTIDAWDAAVGAGIRSGLSKKQAVRAVAVHQPELHQAYLKAFAEIHRQAPRR